jgi:polar amino acid transport system substrate-binding protein
MAAAVRTVWHSVPFLLVLFAIGCGTGARAAELRLLYVGAALPFSAAAPDGNPQGYAVTLCAKMAAAVRPGEAPVWQEVSIADGLDRLASGGADILCGPVSHTIAREARVLFSSPILIGGVGALLRPGAPTWLLHLLGDGDVTPATPRGSLYELDWPRRIAVLSGGTAATWLTGRLARNRVGVDAVKVADYAEAARLLEAGKVGAWVGEWAVLAERARSDPRLAGMTLLPRPVDGEPLALAIRPDETLRRSVQAALSRELRGPGLDALLSQWFGRAGRAQSQLIHDITPTDERKP